MRREIRSVSNESGVASRAGALALALLCGCAPSPDAPEGPAIEDAARLEALRKALDDPLRPEEDRSRDVDRKPAEVLAFFGIGEGMRVAELQGGTGYYAEILSGVVGPEGTVYVQNNDYVVRRFADGPLGDRIARLRTAGRENVVRIDAELDEIAFPEPLDAVLLIRFYHDLFWLPTPDGDRTDRRAFLARVYDALEPGGVFGIVDHHAETGSGERDALDPKDGLHRIDAALVEREVEEAGFVLEAESDVLSNPDDTRDWNIFSEGRRDRTDRFVMRFVKPRT